MGPHDDLVAALDHAAGIFGHRKVMAWCLEWAIAHGEAEPAIFACRIDESAGVAEELARAASERRYMETRKRVAREEGS